LGKHHKTFPREAGETGEVRKLKDKIRRLESDKRRLISELQTLKVAFEKTKLFIDNKLDGVSVEEVIKSVKANKKLAEIKKEELTCKYCLSTKNKLLMDVKPRNMRIHLCLTCNNKWTIEYGEKTEEFEDVLNPVP
jgi:predicted nuclease with TOPRIM domain